MHLQVGTPKSCAGLAFFWLAGVNVGYFLICVLYGCIFPPPPNNARPGNYVLPSAFSVPCTSVSALASAKQQSKLCALGRAVFKFLHERTWTRQGWRGSDTNPGQPAGFWRARWTERSCPLLNGRVQVQCCQHLALHPDWPFLLVFGWIQINIGCGFLYKALLRKFKIDSRSSCFIV